MTKWACDYKQYTGNYNSKGIYKHLDINWNTLFSKYSKQISLDRVRWIAGVHGSCGCREFVGSWLAWIKYLRESCGWRGLLKFWRVQNLVWDGADPKFGASPKFGVGQNVHVWAVSKTAIIIFFYHVITLYLKPSSEPCDQND